MQVVIAHKPYVCIGPESISIGRHSYDFIEQINIFLCTYFTCFHRTDQIVTRSYNSHISFLVDLQRCKFM